MPARAGQTGHHRLGRDSGRDHLFEYSVSDGPGEHRAAGDGGTGDQYPCGAEYDAAAGGDAAYPGGAGAPGRDTASLGRKSREKNC